MNQYERIVSYIYQYNQEEKGANVGYAKVEKRGNQCRISVQMRAVPMNEIPKVYLYKQMPEGIQTVFGGQMGFRGNSLLWKDSCDADKLFGTEWGIEDVDGIFVDGTNEVYFATSWKNDHFYRGNWREGSIVVENKSEEKEVTEEKALVQEKKVQNEGAVVQQNTDEEVFEQEESVKESTQETDKQKEILNSQESQTQLGEKGAKPAAVSQELQMQSICGVCPFKRKTYDYGKKILMTFPSMKPFENGIARACVRMELQDIGCLPIASWSLSGNRFLLHGYYCYRHLLFAQMPDGRYVLGVPGIYSEKERRNAVKFGFTDFQSIGDFGMQQGVFGYWFLNLPEGNPESLS